MYNCIYKEKFGSKWSWKIQKVYTMCISISAVLFANDKIILNFTFPHIKMFINVFRMLEFWNL